MENTFFSFIPDELIYTILSFMNYKDIKSTIKEIVDWCKLAIYKYSLFENKEVNKEKYNDERLCERIFEFEGELENIKVEINLNKYLYINGRYSLSTAEIKGIPAQKLVIYYKSNSIEKLLVSISLIEDLLYHRTDMSYFISDQLYDTSVIIFHEDTLFHKMLSRNNIIKENKL